MKPAACCAALLAGLAAACALADSTIDPSHPDAYGANIGWLNCEGDDTNGAVIGEFYCTGYVWSANAGWIGLGNMPANGVWYSNATSDDWGVNRDLQGNLSGNAWGANIGWITFETNYGKPRVDLATGNFTGYAYGANVGWIGLSNVHAHVRTASLDPGPDSDQDNLPDPWELYWFADLSHTSVEDFDRDGLSNELEHDLWSDPKGRVAPDWWNTYVVLSPQSATNDYAAVNAGQLKWAATTARDAMTNSGYSMSTAAGTNLQEVVGGFQDTNNYAAINIGQVKHTAKPFYDRLAEQGKADGYPWDDAPSTNDYGTVNIGQVKHVFSFGL